MLRDTDVHPTILSQTQAAAEYIKDSAIAIALLLSLATIFYLEQLLEDVTLMMFLEADGKNPLKWREYIQSGEVKILPGPYPGQPDYPDIIRYNIIYPSLPKI